MGPKEICWSISYSFEPHSQQLYTHKEATLASCHAAHCGPSCTTTLADPRRRQSITRALEADLRLHAETHATSCVHNHAFHRKFSAPGQESLIQPPFYIRGGQAGIQRYMLKYSTSCVYMLYCQTQPKPVHPPLLEIERVYLNEPTCPGNNTTHTPRIRGQGLQP